MFESGAILMYIAGVSYTNREKARQRESEREVRTHMQQQTHRQHLRYTHTHSHTHTEQWREKERENEREEERLVRETCAQRRAHTRTTHLLKQRERERDARTHTPTRTHTHTFWPRCHYWHTHTHTYAHAHECMWFKCVATLSLLGFPTEHTYMLTCMLVFIWSLLLMGTAALYRVCSTFFFFFFGFGNTVNAVLS